MSARHPTRQKLQAWLDTGEPRRLSNHIERCPDCQILLEELSALGEGMVAGLQAATSPPDGLRERTHGGVDLRLRNEAAFGAFLDLFAIGWDFTRSILDPELTDGDDPHGGLDPADMTDGGAP